MVLVFSAHSNISPQVHREIERAVHRNVHVIPFRIQRAELSKEMEYFISAPHWLDAMSGPMHVHLGALAAAVRAALGHPPEAGAEPRRDGGVGADAGAAEVRPPRRRIHWAAGAAGAAVLLALAVAAAVRIGASHRSRDGPGTSLDGSGRTTIATTTTTTTNEARTHVTPPTTRPAGPFHTVDLLPLIDLRRDVVQGDWRAEGKGLAVGYSALDRLAIPYEPPDEYDFRVAFTAVGPHVEVRQMLTHAGHDFHWTLYDTAGGGVRWAWSGSAASRCWTVRPW